jgi:hypothetical protein
MKNIKIAFIALTVVVALITLFIRIPLPSRGYFNFGEVREQAVLALRWRISSVDSACLRPLR